MLEKIGLPAKPSMRGSAWVVDASHCQGCSSQFTFINRKHHCRRCGGIFCNSCTKKRMYLRGQGDSPVRICEPCKTLEEAARFELRSGHKNKAGRGSSRSTSKPDDEVLNQILGNDEEKSSLVSRIQRANTTTSSEKMVDGGEELTKNPIEEFNQVQNEIEPTSPEKLRQQAVDEKKRYKILKGEGNPEEALKAFKRGKELERQADALEISIRKNRRKVLRQNEDIPQESSRKRAPISQVTKEKDDLLSELKDLGWTDTDLHDEDKKPVVTSIESELSSLLGDISQKPKKDTGTSGIDKTQVVSHKRKALALKRAGNLAEAKEELKKAKILEKELEEQELLGGAEDSDDELSAIIRNMDDDDDEQDELIAGQGLGHGSDFDHLLGTVGDLGDDRNLEVTDDDLMDPEMAAQLNSLGWDDEFENQQNNVKLQSDPVDRESVLREIDSLKREAVNRKKAGNIGEAMAMLKKAKLLEREMGSLDSEVDNSSTRSSSIIQEDLVSRSIPLKKDSKLAPKNRLMIQKELLALKKKALALRREGKLAEAEEELRKGQVLEQQLEEIDNASKARANPVNIDKVEPELEFDEPKVEADVTDEDLQNPAYLSLLNNLGWKEEDELPSSSVSKSSKEDDNHSMQIVEPKATQAISSSSLRMSKKSKGELQRELLGLKRKALALRRQGKTDEADEVLRSSKALEAQIELLEEPEKEIQLDKAVDFLTGDDRNDPGLIPVEKHDTMEVEPVSSSPENLQTRESENPQIEKTSSTQKLASQNTQKPLHQEILARKRKALAFKREGKLSEAREELRQAKLLEKSLESGVPEKKSDTTNNASPPISNAPSPEKDLEKEPSRSNLGAKKPTGPNRFKLQQESLSHKRQALKLRREGRVEEAEAEFELAKNLEMQLEEMDSTKSCIGKAGLDTDVGVEDFLDPQLLFALKSLGIEESSSASKGPEKISPAKGENVIQERVKLEEQIKAERVKALHLKRSGKQAEALEALRSAKLYEKKLNSLPSA